MTPEPGLNLIKLSVGSETVESLAEWQADARAQGADGLARHVNNAVEAG